MTAPMFDNQNEDLFHSEFYLNAETEGAIWVLAQSVILNQVFFVNVKHCY